MGNLTDPLTDPDIKSGFEKLKKLVDKEGDVEIAMGTGRHVMMIAIGASPHNPWERPPNVRIALIAPFQADTAPSMARQVIRPLRCAHPSERLKSPITGVGCKLQFLGKVEFRQREYRRGFRRANCPLCRRGPATDGARPGPSQRGHRHSGGGPRVIPSPARR